MRVHSFVVCFLVAVFLASFASAEDVQMTSDQFFFAPDGTETDGQEMTAVFYSYDLESSWPEGLSTPRRRRPVRAGSPEPTYLTKQNSLSVVGPNEKGEYSVPFADWSGLPAGVTYTAYSVDVNGNKKYLGHSVVTNETAGHGRVGQLWGPFTGGYAPMPEDIVAFRVEYTGTGNFQAYSVNAKVPKGTRYPSIVDVYPDGRLFLKNGYATPPVASLNGNGHAIVNGWITPIPYFQGRTDVVVAVCSGFPDSECQTQVVDIPAVSQNKLFGELLEVK